MSDYNITLLLVAFILVVRVLGRKKGSSSKKN